MIKLNISSNEIENSIKTEELYNYLKKQGNSLILNKKSKKGTKSDLNTYLTVVAILYPIVKDLQNWVRPKQYTITITDDNVSATINDLTKDQYKVLIEKLDINKTKIQIEK